ncbi:MAG TPA: arginine--tRNA ligase [Candidatus Paceibacterota bacterium]|nr:arginine--tRNA ligase [Candidatus Paceibacterota bacterium]
MFSEFLRREISATLIAIGLPEVAFGLEHPTVASHGDFATNAAMVVAKSVGKNPRTLAEELVVALTSRAIKGVKTIAIAGPGFINFTIEDEVFRGEVERIVEEGEIYGKEDSWDGKKILVEHSSPNLFKPFHIGHLMNNAVGESIKRLAEFSGAGKVTSISFPSDVSLGIAKAVYVVAQDGIEKLRACKTEQDKLAYLGACYAKGTQLYEESDVVKAEVLEISKTLFERIPGNILDIFEECKTINLDYFVETTKRLGSHFDAYIFESEAGKVGEQLVATHIGDVFAKSEGAIIYEGEQDGLHTRVFVNKEGRPTYEAKDLGLLSLKFDRYNPDLSLFITDHEQASHFDVVLAAAKRINPLWEKLSIHRTHGRMTFKGQKMSSRLGGVPLAADIIDTLAEEVRERAPQLIDEDIDRVAIGAIKFAILRAAAGKNINFDPDTSLSFEGDSGPYLQYTVVRARSVLTKAAAEGYVACKRGECVVPTTEVTQIEKMLTRFPEVVQLSINEWAPHHIATYLLETAQAFNGWYGNTKILDTENPAIGYNLAIAKATSIVIERGLTLLGIAVPSKM